MDALVWALVHRHQTLSPGILSSDSNNVHPEANIIGLVSHVAVNLLLDPVDRSLVVYKYISLALKRNSSSTKSLSPILQGKT
jgi:hypothetical protein